MHVTESTSANIPKIHEGRKRALMKFIKPIFKIKAIKSASRTEFLDSRDDQENGTGATEVSSVEKRGDNKIYHSYRFPGKWRE